MRIVITSSRRHKQIEPCLPLTRGSRAAVSNRRALQHIRAEEAAGRRADDYYAWVRGPRTTELASHPSSPGAKPHVEIRPLWCNNVFGAFPSSESKREDKLMALLLVGYSDLDQLLQRPGVPCFGSVNRPMKASRGGSFFRILFFLRDPSTSICPSCLLDGAASGALVWFVGNTKFKACMAVRLAYTSATSWAGSGTEHRGALCDARRGRGCDRSGRSASFIW